MVLFQKLAQK